MRSLAAFSLLIVAAPTAAAELSGSVAAVSDYRFRGVSRSGGDPALQGTLDLATGDWFAGAFASSASYRGGDAEVDLSAGWSRDIGGFTATLGGIAYLYPGARRATSGEAFAWLAHGIGPVELTLGVHYAPDQPNLATDNLYVFASAIAGIPGTAFSIKAGVGHERGANARAAGAGVGKTDWPVGGEWRHRALTLGLGYVGSDAPRTASAPGKIVFNARLAF